jgi:prophage regulatory protein
MEHLNLERKALRVSSVLAKTGISKTQLYRLIERGRFPRPVKLSDRISVWDANIVDQWLAAKFDGVQT